MDFKLYKAKISKLIIKVLIHLSKNTNLWDPIDRISKLRYKSNPKFNQ